MPPDISLLKKYLTDVRRYPYSLKKYPQNFPRYPYPLKKYPTDNYQRLYP